MGHEYWGSLRILEFWRGRACFYLEWWGWEVKINGGTTLPELPETNSLHQKIGLIKRKLILRGYVSFREAGWFHELVRVGWGYDLCDPNDFKPTPIHNMIHVHIMYLLRYICTCPHFWCTCLMDMLRHRFCWVKLICGRNPNLIMVSATIRVFCFSVLAVLQGVKHFSWKCWVPVKRIPPKTNMTSWKITNCLIGNRSSFMVGFLLSS